MNRNEQISAMLDGELEDAEVHAILSTMSEDDVQVWQGFSAVGDLIRSTEMASFHSPSLLARIEATLAEEPTVVAPVLATTLARKSAFLRMLSPERSRRLLASVAAVGFFSFALNQVIPPLDS